MDGDTKKQEDSEPKKLYYIFSKDDPHSFIEFVNGRTDIAHIADVETHILVQLEEYDDEYPTRGEGRFFLSGEQEEMQKWIREREEKEIVRFEVQGGAILYAWDRFEEKEEWDWTVVMVIVFFLLSPVWFIAAVILAYLYFF
jgi:hypothetical protein